MNKKVSIRFKLLVTIIVITLAPIFALSYLEYMSAEKAVKNLTTQDLKYLTHLKAMELAPLLQKTDLTDSEKAKVDEVVKDVATTYYQPNGMIGYAYIYDNTGTLLFHPKDPGKNIGQEAFMKQMIQEKRPVIWNTYGKARKKSRRMKSCRMVGCWRSAAMKTICCSRSTKTKSSCSQLPLRALSSQHLPEFLS
ncbi:UNVERIFIED_CONTAM: signal transduction histidine kinase [Brevibacillus sp. OAP136]